MNPFMLMQLAITMMQLNMGRTAEGKAMVKEALDVVQVLGNAIKDKKITMAEKKAIIKELRQFTKTAIATLDKLIIPEEVTKVKK